MKYKAIRHVFVFRHCVRSTKDYVKLYDDSNISSSSSSEKIPISDFFGASTPMPEWNTPTEWCTETGAEIMKGTGGFLLKDVILGETNTDKTPRKISIQIVTDTVERDIKTSFELYEGLRNTANDLNMHLNDDEKIYIKGLSELEYDPVLFKPENEAFCEVPKENPQRMFRAISDRISMLAPPQDADVALTRMAFLAGIGTRSLDNEPNGGYYSLSESSGYKKFEGPLNALKLMSQMIFYSRASGLDFVPAASLEDVMTFAQWVSWMRSILSVDNSQKALRASTMGPAIIHALQTGKHHILGRHSEKSPSQDGDEVDASVVIFVGHDGDLDTIASAFGLGWTLGPPYLDREHAQQTTNKAERESILSTPPGSGFHFRYSVEDDSLSISILYPTFFNSTNALNTTGGILERIPAYRRSSFDMGGADASFVVETDKVSNVLRIQRKNSNEGGVLDFLQGRLSKAISSHLESDEIDCYSKTMEELLVCKSVPWSSSSTCTTLVPHETFYRIGFYILLGLLAFLSVMTAWRKIRGPRASQKEFDTLSQRDDGGINNEIEII